MWNFIFLITGLIFITLLFISFFSKKIIDSKENSIFKTLIIINIIEYFVEIPLQHFVRYFGVDVALVDLFSKIYLITIFTWFSYFSVYTFVVCLEKNEKKINKVEHINLIIWVIGTILLYLLPFQKFYEIDKMYIYGKAVETLKVFIGIYMVVWLYMLTKNVKRLKNKKYIPIFLILLLLMVNVIIQSIDPSVLIASMIGTFTCYLMYFTIENPDVKMLEELYENKKIIESNNEDTSNFIFKISQDIKKPVDDIIKISSNSNENKLKEINNIGKNLNYLIADALDISTMTNDNLKVYNTKYNPKNLFIQLKEKYESKVEENILLDFVLSETIPEYVYGDSIKLKQILGSVLQNSIDHTLEGTITFEINTIIKYGICRFIIDITDDGEGITIDKVNDILSLKDLDYEIDLNKENLNLKEAKILLNKIGGAFMIKSDEKGTTVSITINQKIVDTKERKKEKEIDLYEQKIKRSKKVMVIDDDIKELNQIKEHLERNNIDVTTSLYGKDIIEKTINKYKYDLIILDDETDTYSAYEVLKMLKKNEKFETPVIVMINSDKEFIKKHYIKDGFNDIIMKSNLKKELDRILKIS